MKRVRIAILLCAALGAAACGGNKGGDQGPDAGAGGDGPIATPDAPPIDPGQHPVAPTVLDTGGSVLASPKVVPIFFANDATVQASIEQFLGQLATSPYWTAIASEYGVGALSVGPTIVSADAAPTTDQALKAYLKKMLDGTHAGWPAADPSTIYSVFLPSGVTLTMGGATSCTGFGAYHSETRATSGGALIYALMPRCAGGMTTTELEELTISASHELIEAATDPLPFSNGAFDDVDTDHYAFSLIGGAEVGDMCEFVRAAPQRLVGDFMVQRSWSNASAAAGHDPCVPVLAQPYIVAAPVMTDPVVMDFGGQGQVTTKGVTIPVGSSKTIDVQMYSDGAAPDWTVKAYDAESFFNNGTAELTFTWDTDTGHNGDIRKLTITHAVAGQYGGSTFVISARTADTTIGLWWGFVGN